MKTHHQFYINGEWVDPAEGVNSFDVINPVSYTHLTLPTNREV